MKPYFSFQWHITDECDQRCKHCYIYGTGQQVRPVSMTWPQIEATLQNCFDLGKVFGCQPYFFLSGGDPLLHPDFWRLLERLQAHDCRFNILGNPFHLDDAVCRALREYGCDRYQLSLDGLRDTHDWFRKPGSYDCTLAKISCLKQAGIRSSIMTTVSRTNYLELPGIIDAVVAAGVDLFQFARYVPCGGEVEAGLTAQEYRELLATCDRKFRAYEAAGCRTEFRKKDHLWTLYDYETGRFQIPADAKKGRIYGGCICGGSAFAILPNGDIYACRRVAGSKVGNVFTDKLFIVWLTAMHQYRDYAKLSKCAKCKLLAWCRGCHAVAYGTSGSFFAADPQCWADENGPLFQAEEPVKNGLERPGIKCYNEA